jgi:hypothetical protein
MKHRALTSTGDWTFGKGKGDYAIDEQAIELNLATRIRSWKTDCFFDFETGIDWVARLDKGQRDNLVNDLKILMIQTYGVVRVNSVSVNENPLTRAIILTYNIDTIFSTSFTNEIAIAAGAVGS